MNYRHAFHAGNFADVHKHVILLALLRSLHKKNTPFFYLDTHAGRGLYDLQGAEAIRSNESHAGIARLASSKSEHSALRSYLDAIRIFQPSPSSTVHRYPGSPLLATTLLRESDRAVFIEKNSDEALALRERLSDRKRISIAAQDGYEALKAHLPPKENRGLVLIDPPYEAESEFNTLSQALQFALTRWANGMYCVWYPIKLGGGARRWQQSLLAAGLKKLLLLELSIRPADSPLGLNGSGLLVANPPWQFDSDMTLAQNELLSILVPEKTGNATVRWLASE